MKITITLILSLLLLNSCAFLAQEEPEIAEILQDAAAYELKQGK